MGEPTWIAVASPPQPLDARRLFTFFGYAPALQLLPKPLYHFVNRLQLLSRCRRQAGGFERQFTGQQQRRDRAIQFAAPLALPPPLRAADAAPPPGRPAPDAPFR